MSGIDLFQAMNEVQEGFIQEASLGCLERKEKRMMWKMAVIGTVAAVFSAVGLGIRLEKGTGNQEKNLATLEAITEEETTETETAEETEEEETTEEKITEMQETQTPYLKKSGKLVTMVLEDGVRYQIDTVHTLNGTVQDTTANQIRMMNMEGQTVQTLLETGDSNLSPYLAVDESRLYYAILTDDMFQVYMQDLEKRNEQTEAKLVMETRMEGEGIFGETPVYRLDGVCDHYLIYSDGLWCRNQVYSYDWNSGESVKLGRENLLISDSFSEAPYLILRGETSDVSPSTLMYVSADGVQQNYLTDSSMGYAVNGYTIYYTDGGRWNTDNQTRDLFDLVVYDISEGKEVSRNTIYSSWVYGMFFADSQIPVAYAYENDGTYTLMDLKDHRQIVENVEISPESPFMEAFFEYEDEWYGIWKNQYAELDFENRRIGQLQNYTEEKIAYVNEAWVEGDSLLVQWSQSDGGVHLTEIRDFGLWLEVRRTQ